MKTITMKTISSRIDMKPKRRDTWETVAEFAYGGDAYTAAAHWELGPDTDCIRVQVWTGKHWITTYSRTAEPEHV